MILLSYGVDVPETELRTRCDCTLLGTDALHAVDAARQLGFTSSGKYTLSFAELKDAIAAGQFPIVFVSLFPIDARKDVYALVVVDATEQGVEVLDPLYGERELPLETFNAAWAIAHHLAILIER
ncbi:MAG TPA: cysteine peptidase family C39 domain-containing protein [Blastocatellia bacterium]|nr:cysteine peptidase family C39 domain-containing protein [Blastocatellia bacterium]